MKTIIGFNNEQKTTYQERKNQNRKKNNERKIDKQWIKQKY